MFRLIPLGASAFLLVLFFALQIMRPDFMRTGTDSAQVSAEEETEVSQADTQIVSRHSGKYGPEQCERELIALHALYPERTELVQIGVSTLNQPIYALYLGASAQEAETRVLVQAGMHGREWINCQLVMAMAEDLLGLEEYAELLNDTAFVFVPMVNPDGVRIAQEGAEWIEGETEREEVRRMIAESGFGQDQWKANGRGVDLNRNFDARWEELTEQTGPAYALYGGEEPESEPETQALVQLTQDFEPDATLSFHSRGEYIYWYFGQTGESLERDEGLALEIRDLTGYACLTREEAEVDSVAGYKDWCVEVLGLPALTIETGNTAWGVPVPIEYFDEIYRCVREIPARTAEYIRKN